MDQSNKTRENRARRTLARTGWGYRLCKSRVRTPHSNDQGKYQIVDGNNTVFAGANYELSLAEVEYWAEQLLQRHRA